MSIKEYDKKGNLIHFSTENQKKWWKYDEGGNMVYERIVLNKLWFRLGGMPDEHRDSETWYKHDKKSNLISSINHLKVDDKNLIKTETWYKNNEKGQLIYSKDSNGLEFWYNKEGDIKYSRNSKGVWRDKEANIISRPDIEEIDRTKKDNDIE